MKKNYFLKIIILALAVFIATVFELLPSGALPLIAKDFFISMDKAGLFTGVYAIGAAFATIPMASLTIETDRKKLFVFILVLFSISGFGFVFAPDFKTAILFRILGGIACGAFWPMISAFAIKISPLNMRSRSIPMIMFGGALGISFGIPFFTRLGIKHGWKFEFLMLSIFTSAIAILGLIILSKTPGEKRKKSTSVFTMIKNKNVLVVTSTTFFAIFAQYASYVYHTVILEVQKYPAEVDFALTIYGIGSLISILTATILLHKFLRSFNLAVMLSGFVAMFLMRFFKGSFSFFNLALILWGFTNGALSSSLQTTISKNVTEGLPNAMALQSCAFDFSIMFATVAGGFILKNLNIEALLVTSMISFAISFLIILANKKTFRNN